MDRVRTMTRRRSGPDRWPRCRAALTLALVLPLLSGCVAGMIARGVMWADDPTPFWVVWEEGGDECTIVFDGVLIRHLRVSFTTHREGHWNVGCGSGFVEGEEQATTVSVTVAGWLKEIDPSIPSRARRGPISVDVDLSSGNSSPLFFIMTLQGLRLGQSAFCLPRVEPLERLRFVYNAGANRNVHVLVGAGGRDCRFE